MKAYHTVCLCLMTSLAVAQNQNPQDSDHFEIYVSKPIKATIYLINGSPVKGMITKVTDTAVLLSVYTAVSEGTQQQNAISISAIRKIKIKRNAVVNGMAGGAVLGGLAGYGVGWISYQYNKSISDADNNDNQKASAGLGALIGAIPGAVVGGMVGGVFTKRSFKINGKKTNILKLKKALEN